MTKTARRKVSLLTVLVVFLAVFLLFLALLQYRWQGRISDAERERMQANLQTATSRFSEDFDREIANAYLSLQIDAETVRKKNWEIFVRRYDAWEGTSSNPKIVKNVQLLQLTPDGTPQMSVFNRSAGMFEPAAQTTESDELRELMKNHRNSETNGSVFPPPESFLQPIIENIPALIAPVLPVSSNKLQKNKRSMIPPPISTAYIIITLDLNFIRQNLMPALANRYFRGTNGLVYNFVIVKQSEPGTVIYKSDAALNSLEMFERNDVSAGIFKVSLFGPGSLISKAESQLPTTSGNLPPLMQTPLSAPLPNSDQITTKPFLPDAPEGVWRLIVTHQAGSLETVVETARRNNLAISFSILGLLAANTAMIILTAKRAQRLARQQTEFAANVSHELRTPLAVISLAGENLADGIVDVSLEARNYGLLIKDEARQLTETIEQVLELAASESGKIYDRKPVNIAIVIENAIDLCRGRIEENYFIIERNIPENLPFLPANEVALTRAIQNLLANSIKYSNGNKFIKLHAAFKSNKNENEVVITIEDNGIGIQADEISDIFEPFCRGREAVKKQIPGSGLGLTLVKRIVETHGGTVSVQSTPGQGSTFSLHLPAGKPSKGM